MGTKYCHYCGTGNPSEAIFCSGCGRPFQATDQPSPAQHPSAPLHDSQGSINPQQPVYPQYPQQPVYPAYPQQPQGYVQNPQIPIQPVVAPPKKKKAKTIILGLLIGIVGLCAVIVGYTMIFTLPIQNTARDFLNTLQNQDYATAFAMMDANVQAQLGSADGLQSFLSANQYLFTSWKGTGVRRISGNPPQGIMTAELTLADGTVIPFEVDLQVGPGSIWQVIGFGPPAQ